MIYNFIRMAWNVLKSLITGFTMTGTRNTDLYGMSNEHKLVGFVVCSIGLWALTHSLQFLILQ